MVASPTLPNLDSSVARNLPRTAAVSKSKFAIRILPDLSTSSSSQASRIRSRKWSRRQHSRKSFMIMRPVCCGSRSVRQATAKLGTFARRKVLNAAEAVRPNSLRGVEGERDSQRRRPGDGSLDKERLLRGAPGPKRLPSDCERPKAWAPVSGSREVWEGRRGPGGEAMTTLSSVKGPMQLNCIKQLLRCPTKNSPTSSSPMSIPLLESKAPSSRLKVCSRRSTWPASQQCRCTERALASTAGMMRA
mmetsp:Transcript_66579/g.167797  ORF Transcript_66579/g.167797 Transcript_66579/m.167797 type:complete len:247 (-) Transcript_66579:2660-3400(-)